MLNGVECIFPSKYKLIIGTILILGSGDFASDISGEFQQPSYSAPLAVSYPIALLVKPFSLASGIVHSSTVIET